MRRPAIYVAGPYRAPNEYDVRQNIQIAAEWGARLIEMGFAAIVPHKISEGYGGYLKDEDILDHCYELVRRCDYLLVLRAWQTSEGTRAEIAVAKDAGIPILYVEDYPLDALRSIAWRVSHGSTIELRGAA